MSKLTLRSTSSSPAQPGFLLAATPGMFWVWPLNDGCPLRGDVYMAVLWQNQKPSR
jgi:hypothetical protein